MTCKMYVYKSIRSKTHTHFSREFEGALFKWQGNFVYNKSIKIKARLLIISLSFVSLLLRKKKKIQIVIEVWCEKPISPSPMMDVLWQLNKTVLKIIWNFCVCFFLNVCAFMKLEVNVLEAYCLFNEKESRVMQYTATDWNWIWVSTWRTKLVAPSDPNYENVLDL